MTKIKWMAMCLIAYCCLIAGPTAAAKSNKPVIAVGEITSAINDFNTMSIQLAIENALTKTNKFTIMERTRLASLLKERGLSISGITNGKASLGGFSGVDYLVYGSVSNITLSKKSLIIVLNCKATLSMNIRVVDVNSGEIRLSEKLLVESVVGSSPSDRDPCQGISLSNVNVLGDEASDGIANKLTMSLFPIKVARVSKSDQVYLNYGEGTVNKGDVLSIKLIGEGFVDPDSGEVLGAEEETTAVIVVSEVRSNFSIGRVVASNQNINVGDVAYFLPDSSLIKKSMKQCSGSETSRQKSCTKNPASKSCDKAQDKVSKNCGKLLLM